MVNLKKGNSLTYSCLCAKLQTNSAHLRPPDPVVLFAPPPSPAPRRGRSRCRSGKPNGRRRRPQRPRRRRRAPSLLVVAGVPGHGVLERRPERAVPDPAPRPALPRLLPVPLRPARAKPQLQVPPPRLLLPLSPSSQA